MMLMPAIIGHIASGGLDMLVEVYVMYVEWRRVPSDLGRSRNGVHRVPEC